MAHDAPQATGPGKLLIRNIGLLLSGALEKPILDADTITAVNGRITAIGRAKDVDTEGATTIVDANGTTVAPGLIDSHVHPVAGDWTPRRQGWSDRAQDGGMGAQIRHPEYDPYRRTFNSRFRPDRQGCGAGSRYRCDRSHQRRSHGAPRRSDPVHLRGLQARPGAGPQRQ